LIVRLDGTSGLAAAKDVVRVSDHYSACFVTKSAEVACWGVTSGGGTWNGIAKKDAPVGLRDVVDVAINQTHACALTKDGAVWCWSADAPPAEQSLPAPAREIAVSLGGRGCALLADGSVASVERWAAKAWERVSDRGSPVHDVIHV